VVGSRAKLMEKYLDVEDILFEKNEKLLVEYDLFERINLVLKVIDCGTSLI
jgi:hypothetical protein